METFIAYQCDACGQMLRTEVTEEDMEQSSLPRIDEGMWEAAIRAAGAYVHRSEDDMSTVAFFARASR